MDRDARREERFERKMDRREARQERREERMEIRDERRDARDERRAMRRGGYPSSYSTYPSNSAYPSTTPSSPPPEYSTLPPQTGSGILNRVVDPLANRANRLTRRFGYELPISTSRSGANVAIGNVSSSVGAASTLASTNYHTPRIDGLTEGKGRRRALVIGIGYAGQNDPLPQAIEIATKVAKFLEDQEFSSDNLVLLTDNQQNPSLLATRANIVDAMEWLVEDAKDGDSLFFCYIGKLGEMQVAGAVDPLKLHRSIIPMDSVDKGELIDDHIHQLLLQPLPAGSRLTAVFDAGMTGSVFDLPYNYDYQGNRVKDNGTMWDNSGLRNAGNSVKDAFNHVRHAQDFSNGLSSLKTAYAQATGKTTYQTEVASDSKPIVAHVVCLSVELLPQAQTAPLSGKTGPLASSLVQVLSYGAQYYTYLTLVYGIAGVVYQPFGFVPRLGSAHPIDLNSSFKL